MSKCDTCTAAKTLAKCEDCEAHGYTAYERGYTPSAKPDAVNHPSHYTQGGVECIDAIRAALTDEEWRGYCKGNVIKYTWRERHKGGDESMRKARWYIERMVQDADKE